MSVKFKFDMPPEAEVIFNQDALKFLESCIINSTDESKKFLRQG